jgi:histidyl-tRNA synthetase
MLMLFLGRLRLGSLELLVNSVGCDVCRPRYRDVLVAALTPERDRLCADCRRRLDTNPLRTLDCKVESDRAILDRVPPILDHLGEECRTHFSHVRRLLDRLGIAHTVAPRLVRGLDYYRRTIFEVVGRELGAQSALLGGGRYDGLVEELGGPAVPGFGFAIGEDRLVMSLPADLPGLDRPTEVFVAVLGEAAIEEGLLAAQRIREAGRTSVLEPVPDRSLKAQLRRANDLKAPFVLILGADEAAKGTLTVKRMADGTQKEVPAAALVETLKEMAHV